jgi:uncharacterized MAPEG superfamily protein
MTLALWSVLAAALLPILCTGIAKAGAAQFDNRRPREWLAQQQGYRARANSAQQNSWEALAVFSAGVFTAHLAHAPQHTVDLIAAAFLAARLIYIGCYLGDQATLRSIAWTAGTALSVSLFIVSTRGAP